MSRKNSSGYEDEVLRARSVRMNYFFNNSREALIFHINGKITDANPALTEMIGFTTKELVGGIVFQWITL